MPIEEKEGLDLAQIRTTEIRGEIFTSKFVRLPGSKEVDTEQVGVVWKKTKQWMIFKRNSKNRLIMPTNRRGIVGKPNITETRVTTDIFVLMRLAARKHFLWHDGLRMRVWKDVIYKDLEPPGYRKKKFPPAKNPGGLLEKQPDPDFFTEQATIEDVQKALNYRRYQGPRKSDHQLHGLQKPKLALPKKEEERQGLEEAGQGQLELEEPIDF